MDIIYKMYFNVIWVLIFGLFFMVYFYYKNRKDLITLSNFFGFIFPSLSVLGGIRIFYSQFTKDYLSLTDFKMDDFYIYYGSLAVVWLSYVGIKNRLKLE